MISAGYGYDGCGSGVNYYVSGGPINYVGSSCGGTYRLGGSGNYYIGIDSDRHTYLGNYYPGTSSGGNFVGISSQPGASMKNGFSAARGLVNSSAPCPR